MNSFPERGTGGFDAGSWLLLAALLAVAASALAPQRVLDRVTHRHLLVFDITQSMNVADVGEPATPQRRLAFARQAAIDALAGLDCGSSVAVGLFTGHRTLLLFTPVEICAHYGEVRQVIAGIEWRMAWEFRSEVAKGLHSALETAEAQALPTSVVFITDGHEAPPINIDLPPRYEGVPGTVRGAIVGVGGGTPLPIPKLDEHDEPDGFFGEREVPQIDPFRQGRPTGGGEAMVGEEVADTGTPAAGNEHLSALREDYLRALAGRLQLDYHRLDDAAALRGVLRDPAYGESHRALVDVRWMLGLVALGCLAAVHVVAGWRRRTSPAVPAPAAGSSSPAR